MKKYLQAGKIINVHGVSGGLKIESWCDTPQVVTQLKKVYLLNKDKEFVEKKVTRSLINGNFPVLFLEGINDRDMANCYKNKTIYAHRDDIPRGENDVLIDDIIGVPVVDINTNKVYGTLNDVLFYGDRQIYEVKTSSGMELIPAVKEFITSVIPGEKILISPIEGMFENEV